MRRAARFARIPAIFVALLACRSLPESAELDASTASTDMCRVQVEGADVSTWKQVRGSGFTFCVPEDWRSSGRTAQRGSAKIEWTPGVLAQDPGEPELGSGDVAPVQQNAVGVRPRNPTESLRLSETIDGRTVELYREALGDGMPPGLTYLTGAQWLGPSIHFSGTATELGAAELQFIIYRTVRFDRS